MKKNVAKAPSFAQMSLYPFPWKGKTHKTVPGLPCYKDVT